LNSLVIAARNDRGVRQVARRSEIAAQAVVHGARRARLHAAHFDPVDVETSALVLGAVPRRNSLAISRHTPPTSEACGRNHFKRRDLPAERRHDPGAQDGFGTM
jgi:hypothetical protein